MKDMEQYKILCRVKSKPLMSRYPYISMNQGDVVKTLNKIELVYQHLTPLLIEKSKVKKRGGGGGDSKITVITMS